MDMPRRLTRNTRTAGPTILEKERGYPSGQTLRALPALPFDFGMPAVTLLRCERREVLFHLACELLASGPHEVRAFLLVLPAGEHLLQRAQVVSTEKVGPFAGFVRADPQCFERATADQNRRFEGFALHPLNP